jgi:hypothetical protein
MENQTFLKDSGKASSTATPAREGSMTKAIEHQTAKIPSTYFLAAAGGAIALSLGIALVSEKKGWANFVGNWVPSILMLGIYNKIVKTHGSDQTENPMNRLH